MNDHDTSAPVQLSETDAITLALRPYTRPVRLRQHELVAVVADSGLSETASGRWVPRTYIQGGSGLAACPRSSKNGETLRDRDCASDGRAADQAGSRSASEYLRPGDRRAQSAGRSRAAGSRQDPSLWRALR